MFRAIIVSFLFLSLAVSCGKGSKKSSENTGSSQQDNTDSKKTAPSKEGAVIDSTAPPAGSSKKPSKEAAQSPNNPPPSNNNSTPSNNNPPPSSQTPNESVSSGGQNRGNLPPVQQALGFLIVNMAGSSESVSLSYDGVPSDFLYLPDGGCVQLHEYVFEKLTVSVGEGGWFNWGVKNVCGGTAGPCLSGRYKIINQAESVWSNDDYAIVVDDPKTFHKNCPYWPFE